MSTKGNHLTIEDRSYIEDALNDNFSLVQIAKYLGKDPTTISKEIRRNRIISSRKNSSDHIICHHHRECKRNHICSESCDLLCKKCSKLNCYKICPDYVPKYCTRLTRFPHACNGCNHKIGCRLEKYQYRAKVADANYQGNLKSSREGIDMMPEQLATLDELISPLIMKGQSIAHILAHHSHEIPCCERTLYTYFEKGLFTAKNIDLPRKVRYKPRKKKSDTLRSTPAYREGRTYDDFKAYLDNHPSTSIVEMDTVHGAKGEKVLLTLFFRCCSLMIAFLLDECTQDAVKHIFNDLYESLGKDIFQKSFPLILTDNGSEFKDPESIEFDAQKNERTKVFYCNPLASYQKPHIEKNHEYIRYILPKGKSFDSLTQEKVTRMINHINSTARASLNGNTPWKLAQLLLNETLLKKLTLKSIPADEVYLKPMLLNA